MLYHMLMEQNLKKPYPILHIADRRYTYQEMHELARAFCSYLCEQGICKGDKVAIIADAALDTVVAILGCMYLGAVFVLIDRSLCMEDRKYIIGETEARIMVENIPETVARKRNGTGDRRVSIQEDDPVYILYTSGSSGTPKGILGKARQIMFCIEKINQRLMNSKEDRILCALPLSFDYGLYQIFLSLYSGAELYLENGKILQRLAAILQKECITAFPVVPSMLHYMYYSGIFRQMDLPYLRYICSTGDCLNLKIVDRVHKQFPDAEIIPMYGLTECKRVSIMPFGRYDKTAAGSCGLPLEGVEVRLFDKDECGRGELAVVGDNVMEEFCAQGNDSSFFFDSSTGKRGVRTGDLFQIDQEGFLYFCKRIKRIIKCRGIRISNARIEQYFGERDEIREVRAEGIPDEMLGERIGVAVYGESDSLKKIVSDIVETIPRPYRPHVLYLSSKPLPKNTNGKFDDRKIRNRIVEEEKDGTEKM